MLLDGLLTEKICKLVQREMDDEALNVWPHLLDRTHSRLNLLLTNQTGNLLHSASGETCEAG